MGELESGGTVRAGGGGRGGRQHGQTLSAGGGGCGGNAGASYSASRNDNGTVSGGITSSGPVPLMDDSALIRAAAEVAQIHEDRAAALLERNRLTAADVADGRRFQLAHLIEGDRHTLVLARVIDVQEYDVRVNVSIPTFRFAERPLPPLLYAAGDGVTDDTAEVQAAADRGDLFGGSGG